MGDPPISSPTGSGELAPRAAGTLLLAGAALILVTVLLPPAATHSDWLILGLGALSGLAGLALWRAPGAGEVALGAAALLGTLVIAGSTYEAGLFGTGADDNEILFLWVCLYCFYFFRLRHALAQLAAVGAAYGALLIAQAPADTILTRWLTTMTTLLVAGLLISRLRGSVEGLVVELGQRARLDSLTGALNRRALAERAGLEFARARRSRTAISVIEVDIDRFKALNDRLGHPAGDDVLKRVARALAENTRPMDLVARVGGDEFAVLLPGTPSAAADLVAERLLTAARTELEESGTGATLSLGIATAEGPPAQSYEELWATADAAMYEAKRAGGDTVRAAGEPPRPMPVAVPGLARVPPVP